MTDAEKISHVRVACESAGDTVSPAEALDAIRGIVAPEGPQLQFLGVGVEGNSPAPAAAEAAHGGREEMLAVALSRAGVEFDIVSIRALSPNEQMDAMTWASIELANQAAVTCPTCGQGGPLRNWPRPAFLPVSRNGS